LVEKYDFLHGDSSLLISHEAPLVSDRVLSSGNRALSISNRVVLMGNGALFIDKQESFAICNRACSWQVLIQAKHCNTLQQTCNTLV